MNKNYKNNKKLISQSYKKIYSIEIIGDDLIVSDDGNILSKIDVSVDNPILFSNFLYTDPYKLLDNLNSVRGLFSIFKRRGIVLSPKKNDIGD